MKDLLVIISLLQIPIVQIIIGLIAICCLLPENGFKEFLVSITSILVVIAVACIFIGGIINLLK